MTRRIREMLRRLAYTSGLLGLIHRLRNRNTLTVFMFHRVLPAGSMEFVKAEREFTFSVTGFAACLDFVGRNYQAVSHRQVRDHQLGKTRLPARAALLTFDDGWRDFVLHALPELRKRSLPAVMFLATEVLDLPGERWWQDMLVEALSKPGGLESFEAELASDLPAKGTWAERVKRVTALIGEHDDAWRRELLESRVAPCSFPRQMVSHADLAELRDDYAIAGHGHRHVPLAYSAMAGQDLKDSKARLEGLEADHWAMSLPHGAFDPDVLRKVAAAGFSVCYSSQPTLFDTSSPRPGDWLVGRVHIPENEWTCDEQGVSEAKLASFLFFRPIDR